MTTTSSDDILSRNKEPVIDRIVILTTASYASVISNTIVEKETGLILHLKEALDLNRIGVRD